MLETHKGHWGRDAVEVLPTATFTNIVHSRYWEAKELVSFILRQVSTLVLVPFPCILALALALVP